MSRSLRLLSLFAAAMLWTAGATAWAGSESSTQSQSSDKDMSIEEAADNLVEDSKKAGEKIYEGGKDAAEWTEEKVKEATD